MSSQHEELEWKKLGSGDLILLFGRRILSVASGIVIILLLMNLNMIPIDMTEFLIDIKFYEYQDLFFTIAKIVVVIYFGAEAVILIWDLLRHFATKYRLAPDCVVKKGGVYRTYTHTIPGCRVQGVEVTANPMQRLVRVSNVTITTAGVHSPNMTIHNLATREAVAIQNQLGVDRD